MIDELIAIVALGAINSFQLYNRTAPIEGCLMIEEIAGYSLRISSGYRKRILYNPTNVSSRHSDCDISQRITSIINSHFANDCARLHTNDPVASNDESWYYKNEISTCACIAIRYISKTRIFQKQTLSRSNCNNDTVVLRASLPFRLEQTLVTLPQGLF